MYGDAELHGSALTGTSAEFDAQMPRIIDAAVKCIKARYSDFDSGVMRAMSIADFKTWPENLDDEPGLCDINYGFLLCFFTIVYNQ